MRVLIVSAEAVPFAKVGGLADVAGSLPAALRAAGIDARVIIPGYGFIEHFKYQVSRLFTFPFTHRHGTTDVSLYACVYQGVPFYFIQGWPYFGQDTSVYTTWDWDVPRFIFFNQTVMAAAWELQQRLGWFPDIFHVNDWHTGLLPFLAAYSRDQFGWAEASTITTIHNIAYQGSGVGGFLWHNGIPGRHHPLLEKHGLTDNLLGIAIAYADQISTVSPRYATEIQYPYAGYELAGLIRDRHDDLTGILNGIDTDLWDPATDRHLVANFNDDQFSDERLINKRHLQAVARLDLRDDVPLIGMVSRLTRQKGFDLAVPALRQLLAETDVQFVVLGTGDSNIEHDLYWLSQQFPNKAAAFLQYDATLAQYIYAGADMFLMPSRFEPCGIGQMLAMRYGALPVVRETGGLADTVSNYDDREGDTGTGFVFQWEEPQAVLGTLRWAIDTYKNRPDAWHRMQQRAMKTDLGWDTSAQQYIQMYRKAMEKQKGVMI